MIIDRILQKIDILSVYSFFLPSDTKGEFENDIERVKEEISLSIEGFLETLNNHPKLMETFSEVDKSETLPPKIVEEVVNKNENTGKIENNFSHKPSTITLFEISNILIPHLTQSAKELLNQKSDYVKIQNILKNINETSSISELYNMYSYNYESFLDLLNLYSELEKNGFIKFTKIENILRDNSWFLLGQILTECNVLSHSNLEKALENQKAKSILLGESLFELNLISEQNLEFALKVQKWIFEVIERSTFVEGYVKSDKLFTNHESVNKIFDFIVPSFTFEAKNKLISSVNQSLRKLPELIDDHSSISKIFEKNKDDFKGNKFEFLKLLLKLDSQKLLNYFRNESLTEREARIRFGELLINLELINEEQLKETFSFRYKNQGKKLYIGSVLVELNYLTQENLNYCLKIQDWCNSVLGKVSYENAFINAIKEVLEDYFKIPITFGKFTNVTYKRPLSNIICITYTFKGNLKGKVIYICDRNFVEQLTDALSEAYGLKSKELDNSIISELCNMITGSSLTKLSKQGVLCETDLPEIDMNNEIMVANGKNLTILPLSSKLGRFIVAFQHE